MGNMNNEVSLQLGCDPSFIGETNLKYDLNKLMFKSCKKSKNSWYGNPNQEFFNKTLLDAFFNFSDSYYNDNSNKKMQEFYDAIVNKNVKEYLLNKYSNELSEITSDKENLSSYIYKKRFYTQANIVLGISNISLIQFYKLNKTEIDIITDEQENNKDYSRNNYRRCDRQKDYNEKLGKIFKKYNEYKKTDLPNDAELNNLIAIAIDDIINLISSANYLIDEFDTSILNEYISILVDHLVVTENKKILYKLFTALHENGNRKNSMFFKIVYDKNVHSKKPFYLYTNHPKLIYYYLLFYKNNYKGKYFRKVIHHNEIGMLLLAIKNVNDTHLNLSKFMPKFEHIFNKYKGTAKYTLNTFLQIDLILTSDNLSLILDILEQNMELLQLVFKSSMKNNNNHYYGFYHQNRVLNYTMDDINFIDRIIKEKMITEKDSERFWNVLTNFILNYNISYKSKKNILKKLKDNEVPGFDSFAVSAPDEIQSIICELYIS